MSESVRTRTEAAGHVLPRPQLTKRHMNRRTPILPRLTGRAALAGAAVVMSVVTGGLPGCAGARAPHASPDPGPAAPGAGVPALEYLAAEVFAAQPILPGIDRTRHFGSISGLAPDAARGGYMAIVDDREAARVARLRIGFEDGRLSVTVDAVEPLVPGPGVEARLVHRADLEAIAALPDGTFVAVEEGHRVRRPDAPIETWSPALLSFGPDLVVTTVTPWPRMFTLDDDVPGVRENQGVESLTRTPDGRLVAGIEQPRRGDAPWAIRNRRPFSEGRGGPGRLIEFLPGPSGWQPGRQWLYPIDPTAQVPGFDEICDDGENGLTELLALDETTFLALERACRANATGVANTAVIYHVSVADAADVSDVESLQGSTRPGAVKTRVLDLATLVPRLPAELALLDNFEAMAFGPALPDGSRTLVVVSDDNFRITQRTVFLLFRLVWQPSPR